MRLRFTWDPQKAAINYGKHGISFSEAATAFADPYSVTVPDPDHSVAEERFVLIGLTRWQRLVVVVHADHGAEIRLISARFAAPRERRMYEEV